VFDFGRSKRADQSVLEALEAEIDEPSKCW
jgi:hypothetical protein